MNIGIKPSTWNKTLVLSSRGMGWKGILVEQYQSGLAPSEIDLPARSNHFLSFHLGQPVQLTHKHDHRWYKATVYNGKSNLVPAGQPSYWQCQGSDNYEPMLHIHLQPELVRQIAETSELNFDRIDLAHSFSNDDLHLQQTAMMLLAELKSGSLMGELYVESLTRVLVIHLLRYYSSLSQIVTAEHHNLAHKRLQQAIDYIHAHLDRDLSLVQIAESIHISPSYFASLFKRATGLSLHQYVIQQRVERAKLLLTTTDLAIASIAFQVGFSSQSHLTQHCKRLTGMTPKQLSNIVRI